MFFKKQPIIIEEYTVEELIMQAFNPLKEEVPAKIAFSC